jgi:two-component system response regulator AtoC
MSATPCNSSDTTRDLRILVTATNLSSVNALSDLVSAWGFEVGTVEGQHLIETLESFEPDVLIVDLDPPAQGLTAVLRAHGIETATIVIGAEAETIARAMKPGVCDLLSKPINANHLRALLGRLAAQIRVTEENQRLRRKLIEAGGLGPIIGASIAMRRVMRLAEEAAFSSAPVLIVGESGTGKKLIARTIHDSSERRNGPYFAVACGGLPDNLMESELWGHEPGAFAGGDRRRVGYLEMANGGTLLLEGITDLKMELQAKLLRTIEDKKLRRIGSGREKSINVRLIAASSRNLAEATHQGRLREDLYSRLNTFTIEVPPLRDWLEDIPALVDAFIRRAAQTNQKNITGIDNECLEILRINRWPGNVLQLRNVIERAAVVARRSLLTAADLPVDIRRAGRKGPQFELHVGESLGEVEREFILKTLDFTNGNKVRAAQILRISLKTLYNKLLRYQGKDRDPSTETPRNHDD